MAATIFSFTSDQTTLINTGGSNSGPDGTRLYFEVSGTNSLVLAKNTAPPGSAVSLTNIAYVNGSLAAQAAGTAITATGLAYVSAADAALDLYAVLNWTSGEVLVHVSPASLGASGSAGGPIPAGDVTAGQFGQFTGSVGDYTFPDDLTVVDVLTAEEAQAGNVNITGNTISSTAGTDLNIVPLAGQQLLLDTDIVVDAGVVTGATSVTSTTLTGSVANRTTVPTGESALVPADAQSAIFASLTVDGTLTVDGELRVCAWPA